MLNRKVERNRVSLLFREVCAVLLTVEDDEEHVSLLCVRYPSPLWVITGGGIAPPLAACTDSVDLSSNSYRSTT